MARIKFFTDVDDMIDFTIKLFTKGRNFTVSSDSNGWTVRYHS